MEVAPAPSPERRRGRGRGRPVHGRVGGRAPARRRQAGRRRRAPGARSPQRDARRGARRPRRRRAGGDPDRPGIVHRLDKDTSGLLVVAKSEAVHRALQEAIRRRELRREYLALVEGCPPARSGTIDAPIGRDRRVRTRMSTDTDVPRAARTHFELERALRRLRAAARHAGDRPHAPDPRAPAGDRPPGRGRPGVREAPALWPPAPVPARRPPRVRASGHRRAGRRQLAAPAGPRGASWPGWTPRQLAETSRIPRNPSSTPVEPGLAPCPARSCAGIATPPAGTLHHHSQGSTHRGSSRTQRAAGGRRPLRPPDTPLEPEDAPLHLRRARRHLPHRPAADGGAAAGGARVRLRARPSRRHRAVRRHEEAGARRRSRSRPRRPACRTSTIAGSAGC